MPEAPVTDSDLTDPAVLPFRLGPGALQGGQEVLCGDTLLRSLPERRLVCRGHWGERPVVIKVFAPGRAGRRHFRREQQGQQALREGGISTPALLYAGQPSGRAEFIHVTEYLTGAVTFNRAWAGAQTDEDRKILLEQLLVALARMHDNGLLHLDPHLENFMVSGDRLYVLDGGQVRRGSTPVRPRPALNNLGLVLAQFPPYQDAQSLAGYRSYAARRHRTPAREDVRRLARRVHQARRGRERRYLRKVFRDCTAFRVERVRGRRCVCRRVFHSPDVAVFRDQPDEYLERHTIAMLKNGHTSTVRLVRMNGQQVVVKRYNIKSVWHAARRALRRTRAAASWRNAHGLTFYGVATPRHEVLLEERPAGLHGSAWLVMEYVPGETARDYFATAGELSEAQHAMLDQVVRLLVSLWSRRLVHGDLKASNIVMAADGPVILDLDAIRVCRSRRAWQRALRRDVTRFLGNWAGLPVLRQQFATALEAAGYVCPGDATQRPGRDR